MKKVIKVVLLIISTIFLVSCNSSRGNAPTIEELKNTMPDVLLNYSLCSGNVTCASDTSVINDIEIQDIKTENGYCTVKCKIEMSGKYIDRVLYCSLTCRKYDRSGWEVEGYTEYGREEIVIKELPDIGLLIHINEYYEKDLEDKTTYTDDTYSFTYTYQYDYTFARETKVAEASGTIYREDSSDTDNKIDYKCDTNISYNETPQYEIKNEEIVGTWANEEYDSWAVGILSLDDANVKWIAMKYNGDENITNSKEVGGISATDNWTIKNDEGYFCKEFKIKSSYYNSWDNYCEINYAATIKIPIDRDSDCIYLEYTKMNEVFIDPNEPTYTSELYRYDQYDLSNKYDTYINGTPAVNVESDSSIDDNNTEEDVYDDGDAIVYEYEGDEYYDGYFNKKGFYGIWCYASEDETDAYNFAQQMTEQGFYGCVTLTTLWSELNSEPYYVVTYGAYDNKSDAEAALPRVQAIYSNAYIKYSGNYIGN